MMRPTTCSTCWSACSWVSFSFLTSRPIWPAVTLRASVSPASTNSCETSLRTTGMPAAAMVWAIWPPIVPAPTTAALNTNMRVSATFLRLEGAGGYLFAGHLRVGLELPCEAVHGALERVGDRPADEQEVHERPQRPALLEGVFHRQGQLHAVVLGRELDALGGAHLRVLHLSRLP